MIETLHNPIITLVFKIIVTVAWIFFLVVGASTIQQIKEMLEVLKPPNRKTIWVIYYIYIGIALTFFLISMLTVWL